MKQRFFILMALMGILFISNVAAQIWNDITPLKSSRSNVEQILGKCQEDDSDSCLYKTEKQNVYIVYSNVAPCAARLFNIPKGTVLSLAVFPQGRLLLSDLNMENFTQQEDPEIRGVRQFFNKKDGIIVEAGQSTILGIYFGPSEKNREIYKCKK